MAINDLKTKICQITKSLLPSLIRASPSDNANTVSKITPIASGRLSYLSGEFKTMGTVVDQISSPGLCNCLAASGEGLQIVRIIIVCSLWHVQLDDIRLCSSRSPKIAVFALHLVENTLGYKTAGFVNRLCDSMKLRFNLIGSGE